ncbi:MAG: D-alanyl-D-alanine carboxypeptidase [Candidatus Kerfeldbacteria bacterium]|nr:D-alanyl-D-alanine carboxypeptidase [Candidatus Kerfeldbacteria bacterium]
MFTLLLGFLFALQDIDRPDLLHSFSSAAQVEIITGLNREAPALVFPDVAISAHAGIVIDTITNGVRWSRLPNEPMPIASLSKLMTALVLVDLNPDWNMPVTILPDDNDSIEGSRLYVGEGEIVSLQDLFYTSLVGSANNATRAMARATGLSTDAFVRRMNKKAAALGMTDSIFYEVTGLDPRNQASAADVARLAQAAFAEPRIHAALQTPVHDLVTIDKGKFHRIKSTNALLDAGVIAKTGYLDEAGYTYASLSPAGTLVVLLRQWSSDERFSQAGALIQWAELPFIKSIFTEQEKYARLREE